MEAKNLTPITQLKFKNLLDAWDGINNYFINQDLEILEKGGGNYSKEFVMYNAFIEVTEAKLDPKFDFFKSLGYKNKKWPKLVNNYINFNYLDLIKDAIQHRVKNKSKHYSFTFHFDNSHSSGKDCLISLTFLQKLGKDKPTVIYHTRASECTKRMLFDFLLIQKVIEYIYGTELVPHLECYIPFLFVMPEPLTLYMRWKAKGLKAIHNKPEDYTKFQRVLEKEWNYLRKTPLTQIKRRSIKRVACVIQDVEWGQQFESLTVKDFKFSPFKKLSLRDIEKLKS